MLSPFKSAYISEVIVLMDKTDALRIIIECACYYKSNYEKKNLLLVCANSGLNKITTIEVSFEGKNFLHLTGVKFPKGNRMSAADFYTAALAKRLSLDSFELATDGTTEMKLRVLPMILKSKSLAASMVGDYNNRKPMLFTERLAGGEKGCIGFVFDKSLKNYFPNTVLNEDIRNNINNCQRVILAYSKAMPDKIYKERVYQAKKIDWTKIKLPDGFEYLPLPETQDAFTKQNVDARVDDLSTRDAQVIANAIATYSELGWDDNQIVDKLKQRFNISDDEAATLIKTATGK